MLLNICTGNLCPFIKPQACQTEGCLSVFRACPVSEEYNRTSAPCNHSKQTCSLQLKDVKVLFPFQILPLNEPHPIKFLWNRGSKWRNGKERWMTLILFQSVTVSIKTFVRTQAEMGSHNIEKRRDIFSSPRYSCLNNKNHISEFSINRPYVGYWLVSMVCCSQHTTL